VVPGMNELLTPEQLAERLGVSLRMVREMYYTNTWPHLRLNKRTVRFTQVHLEEIIAMSERRPTTPVRDVTLAQKADELAQLLGRKKSA
jgi:DNA-directed RNA polymerase sigma subunit (sigma70/sigma32)